MEQVAWLQKLDTVGAEGCELLEMATGSKIAEDSFAAIGRVLLLSLATRHAEVINATGQQLDDLISHGVRESLHNEAFTTSEL